MQRWVALTLALALAALLAFASLPAASALSAGVADGESAVEFFDAEEALEEMEQEMDMGLSDELESEDEESSVLLEEEALPKKKSLKKSAKRSVPKKAVKKVVRKPVRSVKKVSKVRSPKVAKKSLKSTKKSGKATKSPKPSSRETKLTGNPLDKIRQMAAAKNASQNASTSISKSGNIPVPTPKPSAPQVGASAPIVGASKPSGKAGKAVGGKSSGAGAGAGAGAGKSSGAGAGKSSGAGAGAGAGASAAAGATPSTGPPQAGQCPKAAKMVQLGLARAKSASMGKCAKFVGDYIQGAGISYTRTNYARDCGPNLVKAGFKVVPKGAALVPGDVRIIQPIPGHPAGHMEMYTGRPGAMWVSDFRQRDEWPGGAWRIRPNSISYTTYRLSC